MSTLAHWKLFNSFFPLVVNNDPNKNLSQTESLMYRYCIIMFINAYHFHYHHRQCLLINNQELVKALSRIAKDIPLTQSHCSLLHAASRYRDHVIILYMVI